jgi:hypothetical protein
MNGTNLPSRKTVPSGRAPYFFRERRVIGCSHFAPMRPTTRRYTAPVVLDADGEVADAYAVHRDTHRVPSGSAAGGHRTGDRAAGLGQRGRASTPRRRPCQPCRAVARSRDAVLEEVGFTSEPERRDPGRPPARRCAARPAMLRSCRAGHGLTRCHWPAAARGRTG